MLWGATGVKAAHKYVGEIDPTSFQSKIMDSNSSSLRNQNFFIKLLSQNFLYVK